MGINNFFQGLGFEGGRDYGQGFFDELSGTDANIRRDKRTADFEREERKGNISALLNNMGITGDRRALIDMMPQQGQMTSLWDIQNKNQTRVDQEAANAIFMEQMFPQGNPNAITESTLAPTYNEGLSNTESGGNYSAVNDEGYGGRYQFGEARLTDYNRATGQNVTMEQFLASPQIQEAAQAWNVGDTDNFIATNGLDQYIGQNIGGVPMTQYGLRAMAHLGGNTGMQKFLESGGQYNPADSNGTRLSDYAGTHSGGIGSEQPTQQPQPSGDQELMQLMNMAANPNLGAGQKQYLDMIIANRQKEMGGGDTNAAISELEWRAREAGLAPGTPAYQQFILNGGGDPATYRALEMQAIASGFEPGTPDFQDFMSSRGKGYQNFAGQTGTNQANRETGGEAAAVVAEGRAAGVEQGANVALLSSMEAKLPGLQTVVEELGLLSDAATYTMSGQLSDKVRKELGQDPSEGAIARTKYIAMVANQILPLLKETFGAAFTAVEGESLKKTLGDPDATPQEKRAVLDAFIAQKIRSIEALQVQTGQAPAVIRTYNPETGMLE